MKISLTHDLMQEVLLPLHVANHDFAQAYPGESSARQPIHTVYGGAQLFKAETVQNLGRTALRHLQTYAPNFVALAQALDLAGANGSGQTEWPSSKSGIAALTEQLLTNATAVRRKNPSAWLAHTVYQRVIDKLEQEPVEDFRIDFEDGYGNRPDAEEDACAVFTAQEVARGMEEGILPPFLGIRMKPLNEELHVRALRTLDIFISTLTAVTGGKLPDNFVVTLPKVVIPAHVSALVRVFERLEIQNKLPSGTLRLELMMEMPQTIFNERGQMHLTSLIDAAEGRCTGVHFGVYDYTAAINITAAHQQMRHPACDFARDVMQVALAGRGLFISDGATNIMPVGPHRASPNAPLTPAQLQENQAVVHRAWRLAYNDMQHSLCTGYYQGWDLHPAQLPIRYTAVYAFFLESLAEASLRLKTFMGKAAQATLVGDVFDDAATGQALLNYFLRGINCGAITHKEATATGLTLREIQSRSFVKVLVDRGGA